MGKAVVHVTFTGNVEFEFENSGDLLDYELIDLAMENFAEKPELFGQLAEYDWKIERK